MDSKYEKLELADKTRPNSARIIKSTRNHHQVARRPIAVGKSAQILDIDADYKTPKYHLKKIMH